MSVSGCPVITGCGIVAGNGYSLPEWRAALRGGLAAKPEPDGWPMVVLDPDQVRQRLADELCVLGRIRLPGVPGRGPAPAAVVAALEAWRLANASQLASARVGIVVAGHDLTAAIMASAAQTYAREPAHVLPSAAVRMWDSDVLGVISEVCSIRGEGAVVGGASSSGLVALHQAARLLDDAIDAVLIVAPPFVLADWQAQALQSLGAMSTHSGAMCAPFDISRTGFVPGEAAAAVVLETERSATTRGAVPLAWHRGSAVTLSATSGPEPSPTDEARVIRMALSRAGISAHEVSYVNAHGTASRRGDTDEIRALSEVFGEVVMNSTKALVGHGLTSAGLVEYVATVEQLRDGFAHAMPGLRHPEPLGDLVVPRASASALSGRTGLTASYAFGGIHAAAVITGEDDREAV